MGKIFYIMGKSATGKDHLYEALIGREELAMVQNYILGEIARNYEGAFSLAEAWINIEWAELPSDYPEHSMLAVKDVTAEELRRLAQKYFPEDGIIEVVAGKV